MSGTRLLLVSDYSAEHVHGGAERMLTNHVRALKAAGVAFDLLTRQPQSDEPLTIDLGDGVTEYRLPYGGDRGIGGLFELKRGAVAWWREHGDRYDRLVAEQPFVAWALRRAGCRLPRLQVCYSFAYEEYATRHGLDWNLKHRLVTWAMQRLEASVYNSADDLLVLSEYTKQRLVESFGIRADVIAVAPGGVELPGYAGRGRLRAALGWDGPIVVTLRNLVPRTGVDLLVQTAAMLKYELPGLRWCVIGTGALLEPLRAMAVELGVDDCIEFTGFLPEAEVVQRLQAADLFMLPTRSLEGFGLVTVEANANGLPVVATPIGANVELVPSIPHNRLSSDPTPEALAAAVLPMLAEVESHAGRAEELRRAVHLKYDWGVHDEAFIDRVGALA